MNFPRGISTLNGWRIDEDVSRGSNMCSGKPVCRNNVCSSKSICRNKVFQSKPTNVTILRCKHVLTDHSYYVDSSKSTAICFFLSILIFSLHYEFCIIPMNIFYLFAFRDSNTAVQIHLLKGIFQNVYFTERHVFYVLV